MAGPCRTPCRLGSFHAAAAGLLEGSIAGKAWKGMLDVEILAEVLVQKALKPGMEIFC